MSGNQPSREPRRRSTVSEPAGSQNPVILEQTYARRSVMMQFALIVVATCVAYMNAYNAGFIWDDDEYVSKNPVLKDAGGLARLWVPAQTPQYYPLVFTCFWLEHALWGADARGYHVVNVGLHALNAMLLLVLLRRLGVPGAFLAAVIFAVHPVHVESVAWISERKNVLSLAFMLASAIVFLAFEDRTEHRSATAVRRWTLYGVSLALFVAALLSKTVTCFLPVALLLARSWRGRPLTVGFVAQLFPYFVLGAVLGLHTAYLERTHVQAIGPDWDFSLLERTQIAARALLFYPQKLIAPWPLIFVYPKWPVGLDVGRAYIPIGVVLCVIAGMIALWLRGWRGPLLAVTLYAAAIFPALGFFNTYPMKYSFVADHFQYHASIGMIALLVGGVATAIQNRRLLIGIGIAIATSLLALTTQQCRMYTDQCTVWAWTVQLNDGAFIVHNNLGVCLKQAGDPESAVRHFRRAVALKPDAQEASVNLYDLLLDQRRCDEALLIANHLLDMQPESAPYHFRVARASDCLGQDGRAAAMYRRALELDPSRPEPHAALAVLLLKSGDAAGALMHARQCVSVADNDAWNRIVLGRALAANGEDQAAVAEIQKALDQTQRISDRVEAIGALAEMLAASPDASIRDGPRATMLAEELCKLTGRGSPRALDVLAMAYARNGKFGDAVTAASEARDLAIRLAMHEFAHAIEERLIRYRNGQAWISPRSGRSEGPQ